MTEVKSREVKNWTPRLSLEMAEPWADCMKKSDEPIAVRRFRRASRIEEGKDKGRKDYWSIETQILAFK